MLKPKGTKRDSLCPTCDPKIELFKIGPIGLWLLSALPG